MSIKTAGVLDKLDISGLKGLLIDIDDTLYNFMSHHKTALSICNDHLKEDGLSLSFDDFFEKWDKARLVVVNRLWPAGACRSRVLQFQQFFTDHGFPQPFNYGLKYDEIYWEKLIDLITPDLEAERFLKRCKQNNLKIAAVTNMTIAVQVRKLQKLGIDKYFDHMISSEEAKEKPSKEIYNLALEKLGLKNNEVIMIGDNIEFDVKGAEAMGIRGYCFIADE